MATGRFRGRSFGEVDSEPVAAALVAPRHLGRNVAELLLHVTLIDLGGRREPGAERMAGEECAAVAFAKVSPHAGGEERRFDQPGNIAIAQAFMKYAGC